MTTNGISQAGIESNLINQKMNEPNQQIQSRQDKEKDTPNSGTDTINITANISERPAMAFKALDEEKANVLAQLVANDLSGQPFGMSGRGAQDVLRGLL